MRTLCAFALFAAAAPCDQPGAGCRLFVSMPPANSIAVLHRYNGRVQLIPLLEFLHPRASVSVVGHASSFASSLPSERSSDNAGPPVPLRATFSVVIDVARAKIHPADSVVALVHAACSPVRMAISPSGDRLYVTARASNLLLAFDTAKLLSDPQHARIASVPLGPTPVPVVNQGKYVVVGNSNRFDSDQSKPQMLDVLSADPLKIVAHIPAGAFPRETALSPDGNTLFLTNSSSDSLQVIDLKRAVSQ